jgi:tetratricopeptide (TPR) repeat protein
MAKKRLNKKVALIGSVIFIILVLGATAAILYLSRDPEKFAKDGDEALLAKNYETAERCYLKARGLSKNDPFKMQMLFKLVDLFIQTDKWRNVVGCWNEILRIDPNDVKSRYGRLKYFYIMADNGATGVWQEIDSQATQLIELAERENLLAEDVNKWETPGLPESLPTARMVGVYAYLTRGRALIERAKQGAVTDPEESLARATDDLKKVLELDPNNVDAYWYLAQAVTERGEVYASRGDIEGRTKSLEQAKELLEQPVKSTSNNLQAHVNLLLMKPAFAQLTDREQLQTLEPEYLSLVEKFPSDAKAYAALAAFYMSLGYKSFDKAILQIEKAIDLNKENVGYITTAAGLYYRKFSIFGGKEALYKAVKLAEDALKLPDAQDTKGPKRAANIRNRAWLFSFLAHCYIEQLLYPCEIRTEAQTKEWLANAERAVHGIEQIYGSGEEPMVIR